MHLPSFVSKLNFYKLSHKTWTRIYIYLSLWYQSQIFITQINVKSVKLAGQLYFYLPNGLHHWGNGLGGREKRSRGVEPIPLNSHNVFPLTLYVCKMHSFSLTIVYIGNSTHTRARNIILINITIRMISEFALCLIKKRKSKLKMLTSLKWEFLV